MDLTIALAGAAVGTGTAMAIAAAVPSTPDLTAVLGRLEPPPAIATTEGVGSRWRAFDPLAERLGLRRYHADLALVQETAADLAARKVGYAAIGLVFPPLLAAASTVLGVRPPVPVPVLASLLLAAVLFFVPDVDLRRRAAQVRAEMRRAVCIYLELVALERLADAGASEALDRAADIGDGRAFTLIREALLRARVFGVPPWRELQRAATQLRVPELGDVADIMRLSGEDGAAVYLTLRARATSLRAALLNDDATRSNAASEHMVIPVALLGLSFMALLAFPALYRIVFG